MSEEKTAPPEQAGCNGCKQIDSVNGYFFGLCIRCFATGKLLGGKIYVRKGLVTE